MKTKISKGYEFTLSRVLSEFVEKAEAAMRAGDIELDLDIINDNDYTKKQRGALHVWCKLMAEALNDAGFEMQVTILNKRKEEAIIEIPWCGASFKKIWYKFIQLYWTIMLWLIFMTCINKEKLDHSNQ